MDPQSGGLLSSVRNLLGTLLGIARNRLELLATELEEERLRLTRLLAFGVLALFFFGLGVVVVSFFVIAAFWDSYRLTAIGSVAFLHLGLAFYCLISARNLAARKPNLFSATLVELDKDLAALSNE